MDINQNYQTLISNVTYIKQQFSENSKYLPQIQKINSSPDFVVLYIRFFRKSWNIYIGRGGTGTGLMLSSVTVPPILRIKDKFLDVVRASLNHSYIKGIEIDDKEKIINIKSVRFDEKGEVETSFYFYWKGRELYFLIIERSDKVKILKSWTGNWTYPDEAVSDYFKLFDEVGRTGEAKHINQEGISPEQNDNLIEKHYKDFLEKIEKQNSKREQNKIIKKIENIRSDLNKLNDWESFYDFFQIHEQEILGNDSYEYKSIKIKFDKKMEYFKRRNYVFEKCKRGIKNIQQVTTRILNEENKLVALQQNKKNNVTKTIDLKNKIMSPVWKNEQILPVKGTVENKNENYKVITSPHADFAIGLNAQGNDEIRKNWATKDLYWFHSETGTSCHVILKTKNDKSITPLLLEVIGSIIIDYSNIKSDEIAMIYTQVKYLKSLKGSPGSVTFKHEKHIKILYKNDWREIISAS